MRKKTTADFIKQAIEKHGPRYDYSLADYVGCKTEVTIICQEHGAFSQTPSTHLAGSGCPSCKNKLHHSRMDEKRLSTDDFISRSKEIHGDKFDYSNSVFINSQTPVEIYCKQHGGVFHQAAGNHLKGAGCALCAGRKKLTVEDFIKRAKNKHGDNYDSSLISEIAGANSKVKIICKKHGVFEQNAWTHMNKCGCPSKVIFDNASPLSSGIKGFKKESTSSSFSEVEDCIKSFLKRESNAD